MARFEPRGAHGGRGRAPRTCPLGQCRRFSRRRGGGARCRPCDADWRLQVASRPGGGGLPALAGGAALPLSIREYREAKSLTLNALFARYFESWKFKKKATTTRAGEKNQKQVGFKRLRRGFGGPGNSRHGCDLSGRQDDNHRLLCFALMGRAWVVAAGRFDRMVAWRDRRVVDVALQKAISGPRLVDPEGAQVRTARGLGICLGDG